MVQINATNVSSQRNPTANLNADADKEKSVHLDPHNIQANSYKRTGIKGLPRAYL